MKLFALGRIVSAGSVYIDLAGEVAKFTEMAIITLRILSSVGSRDALRATLGASVQDSVREFGHRPALGRAL